MSSGRFPGKMLAPFAGRPLAEVVLARLASSVGRERLVLATSTAASDAPLATYAESIGYQVFRGDLENVFARFQACARAYPADWIVRICGDSPLLDAGLIHLLLADCGGDVDLVTNVATRTFPPGQSVEILNADMLAKIDAHGLEDDEKEHVTKVFYRHPQRYRIRNVAGSDPQWPGQSYVVDSIEDLRRLEPLMVAGKVPTFASRPVVA